MCLPYIAKIRGGGGFVSYVNREVRNASYLTLRTNQLRRANVENQKKLTRTRRLPTQTHAKKSDRSTRNNLHINKVLKKGRGISDSSRAKIPCRVALPSFFLEVSPF